MQGPQQHSFTRHIAPQSGQLQLKQPHMPPLQLFGPVDGAVENPFFVVGWLATGAATGVATGVATGTAIATGAAMFLRSYVPGSAGPNNKRREQQEFADAGSCKLRQGVTTPTDWRLGLRIGTGHVATQQRDTTKLISDLPARGNPRGRLARDQCIPAWALLTGGLGEAKI